MSRPAYIIQDADSGLFLCPYDGDVGYTKLITDAGRFYDLESAIDTAKFILGNQFVVFSFIEFDIGG